MADTLGKPRHVHKPAHQGRQDRACRPLPRLLRFHQHLLPDRGLLPLSGGIGVLHDRSERDRGPIRYPDTKTANPASPLVDPVSGGSCYRYQYVVSDNEGNRGTVTSANIVKAAA